MNLCFRQYGAAAVGAAALLMAMLLAPAGDAAAQGAHGPTAPEWDERVKRFYGRGDPNTEIDRARRQLYGDPLHDKMGVPENRLEDPHPTDGVQSTAPPTFEPRIRRLDRDRDGAVSRDEYFQGNTRHTTSGFRGERLHERHQDRLESQFRKADRNRDGKVTPSELQGGRRF